MSLDAAGVGPQVRCFRLAGLTQKGKKKWTRDKEAEHGNNADEKFVHPLATGELDDDEGNGTGSYV